MITGKGQQKILLKIYLRYWKVPEHTAFENFDLIVVFAVVVGIVDADFEDSGNDIPCVRSSPEDITKVGVGDGETNHWYNVGHQEKHHLCFLCQWCW